MRIITSICLCTALLTVQFAHAQANIGLQNDLSGIMSTHGNAPNTTISSFNSSGVKGNRYLFETWTQGSVISINGDVYTTNYKFNFDKINQDIYVMHSSSSSTVLLDKSKIKYFTVGSLSFINSAALNVTPANVFYQVLVSDSNNVSLYKLTTTKFVKANPNDIMNARTGNTTSEYVDDSKYFVSIKKGELRKINLSEGSIRKALKEKNDKVNTYLNQNSSREVDEAFVIDLVKSINQ